MGGLAGSVNGMDSDVFIILSFSRMDYYGDMHIVFNTDLPEFGHEGVLQFKFFKAFRLLGKQKLQRIDDYHVNIVFLDGVYHGGKNFFDLS